MRGKLTGYVLARRGFATGSHALWPMTSSGVCAGALLAVNGANQRARSADASVLGRDRAGRGHVGVFTRAGRGARGRCSHDHRRAQRHVWIQLPMPAIIGVTVWVQAVTSLLPGGRGPPDGLHRVADVLVLCHARVSLYNSA